MQTARELLAEGDAWTDRAARSMLPVLISRALQARRITYGEMKDLLFKSHGIGKAHATIYGHPAGKVGDVIQKLSQEWQDPIPPLNMILVRRDTKRPGEGADPYMRRFIKNPGKYRLNASDDESLAESTIQAVFDCSRLREIAKHFDFRLVDESAGVPDDAPIPPPPKTRYGRGGESKEHKSLKSWIARNPKLFGKYGKYPIGKEEKYLDSGDEVDVLFANSRSWLGVEVKTADAPEGELWRGIFQCVKYRALLRAMAMAEAVIPNVQAILVLEGRPSDKIKALARRLSVEWIDVGPLRE